MSKEDLEKGLPQDRVTILRSEHPEEWPEGLLDDKFVARALRQAADIFNAEAQGSGQRTTSTGTKLEAVSDEGEIVHPKKAD